MKTTIYIEGGGKTDALHRELRKGFQSLFAKAGFEGRLPKVVACGSRNDAFSDFQTAIKTKRDETILLLVDSEDPVMAPTKWEHVERRDVWIKPGGASEENLYFMVECMESWFLTDKPTLAKFYGGAFKETALPATTTLESISKKTLYDGLEKATRLTSKGAYSKGNHSFKILALLDGKKIRHHGRYAQEFFEYLDKVL